MEDILSMPNQHQDKDNKTLQTLLDKVAVLNKKTQLIDNYVFENQLAQAQDDVKEALSATIGWNKPEWDQVAKDLHEITVKFENSLTDEQQKYYDLIKDYQLILTLANQRSGGQK